MMTGRGASGVFLSLVVGWCAVGVVGGGVGGLDPTRSEVIPALAERGGTRGGAQEWDWAERAKGFGPLEWITRPSKDAVMSFTIPLEVKEIVAKGGTRVKMGEVLVRGRDEDALAAIAVQRLRAGNQGPLGQARASVDSAETRYQRILDADAERAANPQEVDDRRVQRDAARASLVNAESELAQERARLDQLLEQLKRYRIDAPFDGVVDTVIVEVGSSIEPPNPVLRIVNIDTLWIDLPTPTELTLSKGLKGGDPAWVLLDVPGGFMAEGRVVYVSPAADAAAGTRRVRVEIANPKGLPPGTRARVRFEKPDGFVSSVAEVAEPAAGWAAGGRRGVVGHAVVAGGGVNGAAAHDPANCVLCAKAAWEALEKGEDPHAAVARKSVGGGMGVKK